LACMNTIWPSPNGGGQVSNVPSLIKKINIVTKLYQSLKVVQANKVD
jgi:hypothetical protein